MKILRPGLLLLLVLFVALPCLGQPQVAAPEMRPPGGPIQGSSMSVTILCPTSGATIFYTTNGNEPNPDALRYQPGASITVDKPMAIKAKAYKFGMTDSRVSVATYTKGVAAGAPGGQVSGQVAKPVLTPGTQSFTDKLDIRASCATSGAILRYTFNGPDPTEGSGVFQSGEIKATTIVKVRAFKVGMAPSEVVTAVYTKLAVTPTPAKGVVTPAEKAKSAEECNRIQNLQREIDKIKAERANRRRALGLDPDPDCRMK